MAQTERISITDFPPATIDTACNQIAQFTVGLNRVFRRDKKIDSQLIGAGTLVNISGVDCILTADHVLGELRKSDRLNLISSFTGEQRAHTFPYSHLGIHRIGRGSIDETGPDIGLIVLPQQKIAALRSEKVFYNIDKRANRFSGIYLPCDHGLWFNCGLIGESEQILDPRPPVQSLKGYQALCGASASPTESHDGEFDYLEVRIDYGQRSDLPLSFGGMSGGGLWQVLLRRDAAGDIEPEEYILSGVTFFQTAVEQDVRKLRCHGRKTVYEYVPKFVRTTIQHA